ncbi:UDP-N-acetylglucosamine acyltransferase [Photorhabdus noenieputensis]|uniref:lipoprotein n=1 Tax=Photorhabdus noenieputensis TaxID=1208607 RepID=UPI001FD27149|nr:lipoprotein [Photorhabdus noenieputensis]MBS9439402.1 UDP-N-acetylglucosamine acyltransferase [Photorhabdus noenieputensis]MCK3670608.1 lipoprotein [Photorhabdus noenieputensis]
MKRLFAIFLLVVTLSGCQTPPPLNFSVPNVGGSGHKIDAELKSITIVLARPEEQKGGIQAGMEEVPQFWKASLEEALGRMAIFKDDANKKVNLAVKILAIDMPLFGTSMTTKAIARYELIDRSDGRIIYSEDISSNGTVPFNYALLGYIRGRESINRAAQNNITQFLQSLGTVDNKLMPFVVNK